MFYLHQEDEDEFLYFQYTYENTNQIIYQYLFINIKRKML